MSTKHSIFLTDDDCHLYQDMYTDNIYIEIPKDNITFTKYCEIEKVLTIAFRHDSELSMKLKTLKESK